MVVFARQIECCQPFPGPRTGVGSGLEQQVDHRRIAEINRSGIHQRRHPVLVEVVHVRPTFDLQARHLHAVRDRRPLKQRDAVITGFVHAGAGVQQCADGVGSMRGGEEDQGR